MALLHQPNEYHFPYPNFFHSRGVLCSFVTGSFWGSILIYANGSPKISKLEISATHDGTLQNKFVTFLNAPDLKKNAENCFCYPAEDIRFAYVQACYHITKQLQFFKEKLKPLNISMKGPLKLNLLKFQAKRRGEWFQKKMFLNLIFLLHIFTQTSLTNHYGLLRLNLEEMR